MEFEWKVLPRIHYAGHPEQFKDRIIFMSVYNDIFWWDKGNTEKCEKYSVTVANYAHRFPLGRWSFLGPGSEKKWYGTYSDKPDGDWDKTAEQMMLELAESSHPIFRATSAMERGELRSKVKGKKSIHFNGSEENIELILRTVISVNQVSIYGAAADPCRDLTVQKIQSFRETWCKRIFGNSGNYYITS